MPKIEAGTSAGIFLIDGIPYPTTQYVPFYNTKTLTKLAAEVNVDIKQTQGDQLNIASGTLSLWTDNLDAGFTDLQAFVTYILGFFFEKSGGGGGGGDTLTSSFRAVRATSTQLIGSSVETTLIYNDDAADNTGSNYVDTTGVYTAPTNGVYSFSAYADLNNAAAGAMELKILLNGSDILDCKESNPTIAGQECQHVSVAGVRLAATDTIKVSMLQTTGFNVSFFTTKSNFSGCRIGS